jgi:hypothetical protein
MKGWLFSGRRARRHGKASLQWAPTLTNHDPNPPITIESPTGGGEITGTLAATLGALTLAATATVAVSGQAAPTLAAATVSGAATVEVQAVSASELSALTVGGTAEAAIRGTAELTLDALVVAGVATVEIRGSTDVDLAALMANATGSGAGAEGTGWPPWMIEAQRWRVQDDEDEELLLLLRG